MRHVTVRLTAHDVDPETAYRRISDFRRYPEVTETVREVVVHPPHDDGTVVSDWTVRFRNGLMRWSERDAFFPKTRTIGFTQLTGDFELFEGTWRCASGEDGTAVTFDAVFDLGIPTLAELLDPVADSTLRSNIERILRGLLGRVTPTTPAQLADSVASAHG
ncbi:type II toxin-antitoxin system RatA family toxin [Streptomyces sp. NPDC059697]|uniref:type II toxin-antitoxin system RatA family toxin n=1 Tax=Streptomyces sp. NPDC059697 TaxID=3346912 RepID=UPI0036B1883E